MFGDGTWLPNRTSLQFQQYERWLDQLNEETRLVVIELGAGTAVPTVRYECERRTRAGEDRQPSRPATAGRRSCGE